MENKMRVVAIVQARLTSYRFPEKVIKKICGKPMIEFLLNRLACSKKVDKIVIAIPEFILVLLKSINNLEKYI